MLNTLFGTKFDVLKAASGRYLIQLCTSLEGNTCGFLDPGKIHHVSCTTAPKETVQYICDAMLSQMEKEIILVPYHQINHWILLLICPRKNLVGVMDPNKPKNPDYSSYTIIQPFKKAFLRYIRSGGLHDVDIVDHKVTWKWFMCPQQWSGWECGYYTMKYMLDFVTMYQKKFPKCFADVNPSPFEMVQLDEIRGLWARFFLQKYCP